MLKMERFRRDEFAPFVGSGQTAFGASKAAQTALAENPQFIFNAVNHGAESANFASGRFTQRLTSQMAGVLDAAFDQLAGQHAQNHIETDGAQGNLACGWRIRESRHDI